MKHSHSTIALVSVAIPACAALGRLERILNLHPFRSFPQFTRQNSLSLTASISESSSQHSWIQRFCSLTAQSLVKIARPQTLSQLQPRLVVYSLVGPSTEAPKPLVKTTVCLSAAAQLCQLLFETSRRMRTKLTNLTRIRR